MPDLTFTDGWGPAAGIAAAALWAVSSVIYSRIPIGAGAITSFKNVFSATQIGALLMISRSLRGLPVLEADRHSISMLAISGIIGLVIGDVAFFRSLQLLGPRGGLTLTLMTPPITALFGQWFLDEQLPAAAWIAILITMLGIGIVMHEQSTRARDDESRRDFFQGVLAGIIGVLGQAAGCILMKQGSASINSLEATFWRLFVAAMASLALVAMTRQKKELAGLVHTPKTFGWLCLAATLGTCLGVWLMLISFKYSPAGVAATVTSTSPLFVIPIVAAMGQKVTKPALLGAIVAFVGVCWLVAMTQSFAM